MTAIYHSDKGFRAVRNVQRTFLQQWPVPSTEITIRTRHGETFVVASGPENAAPLILLHGAGFNSVAWIGDVPAWARTHRVCAIDVIGEPGLSAPSRPALDSDAYAEWLDDVWDGLGFAAAAVVGTSFGAWLAVDYAVRRPSRVSRLALLSPGGIGGRSTLRSSRRYSSCRSASGGDARRLRWRSDRPTGGTCQTRLPTMYC